MIRLLAGGVVNLLANVVALVVASLIVPDLTLELSGFVTAVVFFTIVSVVIEPLIRQIAIKNVRAILGSTALIATLVSLVATVILTDGLRISGLGAWVLATVVVWAVAIAARLLLPLVIFKQVLAEAQARRELA